VIGCLVARAITGTILATIARDWVMMVLVVSTSVAAGAIVGWVLVKFRALPGMTAAWGSTPGAASAMVMMAEEYGADARLVALMQYLRVVMVVLSASVISRLLVGGSGFAAIPASAVPAATSLIPLALRFLETMGIAVIGATLGRRFKVPAGGMIVPMVLGSILHATGLVEINLPPWLLTIAYATIGWYIGLGFDRDVVVRVWRAIPHMMLATILLIGLCGLSAWLLTAQLHTDPLTAYLATSPGGLDSVAIIAVGSNADIPFVLAVQTLRLFIVLVTGPILAKLISRYA
jgi:membrane AbrB-like protein